MSDRAVIAFVEILDDDFPVCGEFVGVAAEHLQLREVDASVGKDLGQFTDNLAQRTCVRCRVYEDQRAPGLEGEGRERERLFVEDALFILARGAAQRAIKVVGPSVIVALQSLAIAGAFEDDFAAAMTAYVGECAKGAVVVSGDDDRDVADSSCEEIAGATYLSGVPDILP